MTDQGSVWQQRLDQDGADLEIRRRDAIRREGMRDRTLTELQAIVDMDCSAPLDYRVAKMAADELVRRGRA